MNLHQVLTGAVNPGDHCFSVGSVGDQRFTVSEGGFRVAGGESAPLSQPSSAQNDGQRPRKPRRPHGGPHAPLPSMDVPALKGPGTWRLRTMEAVTLRSLMSLMYRA
ncbi:hypothetical protein CB1_000244002 [Camelus ferus]|nr:hypothetical protein CB1_000244002 [Camelus ferus]